MWNGIRQLCKNNFNNECLIVDFEVAALSAVRNVFPNARLKCCSFHLRQAWLRKIVNIGLKHEYMNGSSELGQHLKYSFGLQYLPPDTVGDGFC